MMQIHRTDTPTPVRATSVGRHHCLPPARVDALAGGGSYRQLFADLPLFCVNEDALHALGRPGGPCDVRVDGADATDSHVAAV
jgi:hypothetical protein